MEIDRECELRKSVAESDSDVDEATSSKNSAHELIHVIRKDLSISLRDLFEHGLIQTIHGSSSLVPAAFSCFPIRARETESSQLHVWDLFIKYFEIKVL